MTSEPRPTRSSRVPGHVDGIELGQPLAQLGDPRPDEGLPLQRRVVLGVLPQIAHGHRGLDLLGQLDAELVLERLELRRQPFEDLAHRTLHPGPADGRSNLTGPGIPANRGVTTPDPPGTVRSVPPQSRALPR